jgi:hypothetical protein
LSFRSRGTFKADTSELHILAKLTKGTFPPTVYLFPLLLDSLAAYTTSPDFDHCKTHRIGLPMSQVRNQENLDYYTHNLTLQKEAKEPKKEVD